VRCSCTNG